MSAQNMYGITVPTSNYVNSVSETFPSDRRQYKIESTIDSRNLRDFLPTNVNLNNGSVNDNYIEFILEGNSEEFYDLSSCYIEMKIRITKADGSPLDAASNVTVIDGMSHRILNRSSIYLNSCPIESNSYFGVTNLLRNYLNMDSEELKSVGRNMFYKSLDTTIHDKITAAVFDDNNMSPDEASIIRDVRDVIHTVCPLMLDISTSNFYLLNNVGMRLRFDLAPSSVILNTYGNEEYKYKLDMVKMWCSKIKPVPGALLSLQKHLTNANATIEYLYDKPVVKSFIFPTGHNTLMLDNVFSGMVPNEIFMCIISQTANNGSYTRNASYFSHCNLSNVTLDINGNTVSKLTCTFPSQIAQIFHNTISNLANTRNLLTIDNFKRGRTIMAWNLSPTTAQDVLNLERTGNVRISLNCAKPPTENHIVFVVGMMSGLFEIDSNRRVTCNNKM